MALCGQCGKREGQKDGLCPPCRLRGLGLAARMYRFSPELRDALRAAYRLKKYERARALDRMVAKTGWPRHAFQREAGRLGITTPWRRWTKVEDAYLLDRMGAMSVSSLARKLRRTRTAVESRIFALGESRRARREGYSLMDVQTVFGCNNRTVKSWADRGLLGKVRELSGLRVDPKAVANFARRYAHEYDLRKVDQVLYKALLFGEMSEVA